MDRYNSIIQQLIFRGGLQSTLSGSEGMLCILLTIVMHCYVSHAFFAIFLHYLGLIRGQRMSFALGRTPLRDPVATVILQSLALGDDGIASSTQGMLCIFLYPCSVVFMYYLVKSHYFCRALAV